MTYFDYGRNQQESEARLRMQQQTQFQFSQHREGISNLYQQSYTSSYDPKVKEEKPVKIVPKGKVLECTDYKVID